jgi:hypothetical protein
MAAIADFHVELQQFRLLVLHRAWIINDRADEEASMIGIAAVKIISRILRAGRACDPAPRLDRGFQ